MDGYSFLVTTAIRAIHTTIQRIKGEKLWRMGTAQDLLFKFWICSFCIPRPFSDLENVFLPSLPITISFQRPFIQYFVLRTGLKDLPSQLWKFRAESDWNCSHSRGETPLMRFLQTAGCTGKKTTGGNSWSIPDSEGNCRLQGQHVGDHHRCGHTYRQHVGDASQETSSFCASLQKSWRQKRTQLNPCSGIIPFLAISYKLPSLSPHLPLLKEVSLRIAVPRAQLRDSNF